MVGDLRLDRQGLWGFRLWGSLRREQRHAFTFSNLQVAAFRGGTGVRPFRCGSWRALSSS